MVLRADLPREREDWAAVLAGAMGSPDVHERQLNGMGGGLSSLSKVCIVEPSEREDADVDFTFAQVGIATSGVDYSTNCGNMASAVGPFAMDRGLVPAIDGEARVRIFNTNTRKLIHATFLVREGRAVLDGDFAIPGVSGTGRADPAGFRRARRSDHRASDAHRLSQGRPDRPGDRLPPRRLLDRRGQRLRLRPRRTARPLGRRVARSPRARRTGFWRDWPPFAPKPP